MEQNAGTTITYISSRELTRVPGKAKHATRDGPVFITEHGQVRYVLLAVADYEHLAGQSPTLAEAVGMPGPYVEFEPARLGDVAREVSCTPN